MGSVLSDVQCHNCGYDYAMEDFYYKSNEVHVFCERCGYSYDRTRKFDKEKGRLAYGFIGSMLRKKKINKEEVKRLWKLYGYKSTTHKKGKSYTTRFSHDKKVKELTEIRETIKKYDYNYYYMDGRDKDSYEENVRKAKGSYKYGNSKIAEMGGYTDDKFIDEFKEYVEGNDEIVRAEYSKCIDGNWITVDIIKGTEKPFEGMYEIQNETKSKG